MSSAAPMTAAYKSALLALQKQQVARLSTLVQQTEAALAQDWQRGPRVAAAFYAPVLDEYAKALNALRLENDDAYAKLPLDWLKGQNTALASIEKSVTASMVNYSGQAAKTVEQAQAAALGRGALDAENLTQEALSPAFAAGVDPSLLFNRPNPDAIGQWLGRSGNGHPLGDLFANFSQEATSGARQAMLMGLAMGSNPKVIAQGIQQALGVSRSRALTIARTEVLGSYRAAAHETYRANSDVLGYWLWSAGGNNPCAMCAGMDGTLHDLSEDLNDHPCGKCAPIPVTKPWSDILGPLGIDASDIEETSIGAPGNYTSISDKFDSYSEAKQREIIGTQVGYDAFKRGEVTLKDFIGVRPGSDGFPSSYYQRSLKEMMIPTRQASRLVRPSDEILEKMAKGTLRYTDLGHITPDELMPAWAKQSEASRIVFQILHNGLPYDMTSHEQGLLVTNLAEMLKGELPVNVRAAVERQLQALGQVVERQTIGRAAKLAAEREADFLVTQAPAERAIGEATFRVGGLDAEALARESAKALEAIQGGDFGLVGDVAKDAEWAQKVYEERIAAVERISKELGGRLADNPEFMKISDRFMESFEAQLRAKGYPEERIAEGLATVPRDAEGIAKTLLNYWSGGSDNSYIAAIQRAVRDEFNLDARLSARDALAAPWEDYQPGLRAFVREMYNNTQDYLKANDVIEMPLYRGTAFEDLPKSLNSNLFDGEVHVTSVDLRALSAFTADSRTALDFSELPISDIENANYHMAVAARIPRELILATPQTGFGSLGEFEVTVLGGQYDAAFVGTRAADGMLKLDQVESLLTQNVKAVERQLQALGQQVERLTTAGGKLNDLSTLSGARAEVRDAQKALRAAEDAVRADYLRNPQGLLSSALRDDRRVLDAQARLEAAQARVSELRQADAAAKIAEAEAAKAAETAASQAAREALEQITPEQLAEALKAPDVFSPARGFHSPKIVTIDGQQYVAKIAETARDAQAEAGAAQVAQMLGIEPYVVPTTLIDANDETYVVSIFAPNATPVIDLDAAALSGISDAAYSQATLFNYAIGEMDQNSGNLLFDVANGRLITVDHSAALSGEYLYEGADGAAAQFWHMAKTGITDWRDALYDNTGYDKMFFDRAQIQAILGGEQSIIDYMRANGLESGVEAMLERFDILRRLGKMKRPTYADLYRLIFRRGIGE